MTCQLILMVLARSAHFRSKSVIIMNKYVLLAFSRIIFEPGHFKV